jgi:hypothetical protein
LSVVSVVGQTATFEKNISIPALEKNSSRYFYVDFEVPANTRSLSFSYQYDKKNGANVLDLGVFDAAFDSTETNVKGFRGWSGGRRNAVFIAENAASNGYVAGKIPAGKWRIILGLYKVAPEGVDVSVKVKFNEIDATAEAELKTEQAKFFDFPKTRRTKPDTANGYKWFRGDLHTHTFYSDGNWTVKGLLDFAENNNLDFIGITDHNTFAHHAEIDRLAPNYKNLLVLRGEEVTTYGGHFNVWGLPKNDLIDFRVAPADTNRLQTVVDSVHKSNLPASINHPTAICGGCDWSYGDWSKMDSVEIWNGAWDFQDENALKKWDDFLQTGGRITAVGSSDTHSPPAESNNYATNFAVGTPTTHVGLKKLSQPELLAAIKSGRVWISDKPDDYHLEFSIFDGKKQFIIGETAQLSDEKIRLEFKVKNFPEGASISLISNGKILQTDKLESREYALNKTFNIEKDSYFRVEIRGADGAMIALTNPIYIRKR